MFMWKKWYDLSHRERTLMHCVWKKRDQNVFCNISYETWEILMKFGT